MKILIIEDERLLAESIKSLLEAKVFKVEVIFDSEDGATYAQMGIYDLLILYFTIYRCFLYIILTYFFVVIYVTGNRFIANNVESLKKSLQKRRAHFYTSPTGCKCF